MEVLVFGKKVEKKDGTKFTTYLTTLRKKNGEEIKAKVKFTGDAPALKQDETPCYIEVAKENANLSSKKFKSERNGIVTEGVENTLWVSAYTKLDKKFVDTSLEDFE